MKPSERRHQRTKQAILDAARKIITTEGPEALSIRALASAIDYSPAGLYEYFGGKEEIVGAVVEQGFECFIAHLQQVDTMLPAEIYINELSMAYIDFAVQNPDFFLLMFTTVPLMTKSAREQVCTPEEKLKGNESFSLLYKAVNRCVEENIFTSQPEFGPLEMAYAAWTQVHGIAMLRITNLENLPLDYATVDHMAIQALTRGLRID